MYPIKNYLKILKGGWEKTEKNKYNGKNRKCQSLRGSRKNRKKKQNGKNRNCTPLKIT